jgi:hypothetical protein
MAVTARTMCGGLMLLRGVIPTADASLKAIVVAVKTLDRQW